ncbi:MAG TPA: hypothetical protein VEC94_03575 [Pseudolabrys sp.]|nr:hypothetical protein [Pseudolabrys sp.]
MTRLAILIVVAVTTLCGQLFVAIADDVPKYDVRKTCKADVQAYSTGGNVQGCLTDEQSAQATLVTQWTQFAPDSRARCSKMVGDIAGSQSYVELLTCLQMAKDVKTLPKE